MPDDTTSTASYAVSIGLAVIVIVVAIFTLKLCQASGQPIVEGPTPTATLKTLPSFTPPPTATPTPSPTLLPTHLGTRTPTPGPTSTPTSTPPPTDTPLPVKTVIKTSTPTGTPETGGVTGCWIEVNTIYHIQPSDSLWKIAECAYGDGKYWPVIYQVNPQLTGSPNLIHVGNALWIPPLVDLE